MPTEQRWREGFFYNWPFPLGPRLTGWEEETGGQRSACSLPPTHTHKLPRQRKQTEECLGPGWFGNLDKPSPSSCFRHIFFTDVSVTPKQDTLKQNTSQCTTHSQRCRRKRCSLAHANIRAGWRQALQFSVGSRVLHKTSVTLIHHGEWVCVCKPPWKAPLFGSANPAKLLSHSLFSYFWDPSFFSMFKKAQNLRELLTKVYCLRGSWKLDAGAFGIVLGFFLLC